MWNSGTEEKPEWETQIKSGNLGISNAPIVLTKMPRLYEMLTEEETRQRVYGNFL